MPQVGSKKHEEVLKLYITELEEEGFKVIDLKGKSPDAIAVKDNKVCAVEVLGSTYRKGKGWHKGWTRKHKQTQYSMFDDVFIRVFKR